jgi:putative ABC transport system permease protein
VGQTLTIDGKSYEIVGVAPKGFFGVEPGKFVDVWLPGTQYDSRALAEPGWHWFRILGRPTRGVSPGQIQARLQPSFHQFQMERLKRSSTMPAAIRQQFIQSMIRVHPASAGVSDFRRIFSCPLWIVAGVGAGILLIACANVATLLLARSTARTTEMALRISLGAARIRLVRQMLTESLMLSLMAGGLGWLLARVASPLLVLLFSASKDPVRFFLAVDTRVLVFCIGVSALSAVAFGLVPAWQASAVQPIVSLRASSGEVSKLRLGKFFVSLQIACAFCLVLSGAAFLFSLRNLLHVDPGFDARNVAVLDIATDSGRKTENTQRELGFQLQRRVMTQTGIQSAAVAMWPIFEGGGWSQQMVIPGKRPSEQEEIFYRISPSYFAALRTPLRVGRDFEFRDSSLREPTPAIVNETFARKYFNSADVLGREFGYSSGYGPVRTVIVGVALNTHYYTLRTSADPIVYLPMGGSNDERDGFTLYVRSALKLATVVRMVDHETHAVGSGMRVRDITTMEAIVGDTLLREKLLAEIGGSFAFFGLLLAAIGLFGLLSYSVGRRTKEMGIRTALGARRMEIVSLVLKDMGGLMGGGLVIGLASASAIMTMFRTLLFGIRAIDPTVIATAAGLFVVTTLLAAGLPAYRAATIDPMSALREE